MAALNSLTKMISRNALILSGFAIVCVGLIAFTFYITKDTIASEMKEALARTLNQLVPAEEYDNDVYHDCVLMPNSNLLGNKQTIKAYRMRKQGKSIAIVLEATAPNGYSGAINMVVGIYFDGTIAGVRVTEHQETPGLGDKIDITKSDWILDFKNRSLQNPYMSDWKVKKDGGEFDAFTGATITPRAVVEQVAKTLEYYQQNSTRLFAEENACEVNP